MRAVPSEARRAKDGGEGGIGRPPAGGHGLAATPRPFSLRCAPVVKPPGVLIPPKSPHYLGVPSEAQRAKDGGEGGIGRPPAGGYALAATPRPFSLRCAPVVKPPGVLIPPKSPHYLGVPSEARRAKDGGEGGIRTPGALRLSGFQDRRNRPLCHLTNNKLRVIYHAKSSAIAILLTDRRTLTNIGP
jgi:hypothetical protein